MATQVRTAVLNPEAQRTPVLEECGAGAPSWSMAARLDSLNGKTVYLVNQGFGGSDLFMEAKPYQVKQLLGLVTSRKNQLMELDPDQLRSLPEYTS